MKKQETARNEVPEAVQRNSTDASETTILSDSCRCLPPSGLPKQTQCNVRGKLAADTVTVPWTCTTILLPLSSRLSCQSKHFSFVQQQLLPSSFAGFWRAVFPAPAERSARLLAAVRMTTGNRSALNISEQQCPQSEQRCPQRMASCHPASNTRTAAEAASFE